MSDFLTPAEIATLQPTATPAAEPAATMRNALQRAGQWLPHQMAGRRWPIACVSLEITQRCNLDCTLCYLSDSAQAVRDLPMEEVFRRIDMILAHYGPGTDVQISGGEPTLRERGELVAIVARVASLGMRPTLMTNGIRASRDLLQALAGVGLVDVAFHVDTTQERAGYGCEVELNALRREYVERARGLPLGVFFNTSVHAGNLGEVSALAAFFREHADVVRFASFQLQADTGRGAWRGRDEAVTQVNVQRRLADGAGTALKFNTLLAGHHDCNRSAVVLVANGRARDAFHDEQFIRRFMRETTDVAIDRRTRGSALASLARAALSRPRLAAASLAWAASTAWRMRGDLWRGRGRVHKLTFFIHNFMDACHLERDRVDACVFTAMTQYGPLSMCAYNAKRDDYLLQPLATADGLWQPLRPAKGVPIHFYKGRGRAAWRRERAAAAEPVNKAQAPC